MTQAVVVRIHAREPNKGVIMKWKPIKSAPKDAAELLLWAKGKLTNEGVAWMGIWEPEDEQWHVLGYDMVIEPSHWMHIPEGPKEPKKPKE